MDVLALFAALLLVGLNAFFVATEFAIVKVRPTRIEELIRKNKTGAAAARRVLAAMDSYLSATQLGITLASLGLGWIGEPAFARLLDGPLTRLGIPTEWSHAIALGTAFVIITFLHIVVGELAPKSLAILHAESVAVTVAHPMRLFYVIFFPVVWALDGVSTTLLRLAGVRGRSAHLADHHSEEEIKMILAQARSAGLLSPSRGAVLHKALSLSAKKARHLMVPRSEVVFLDIHLSFEENLSRAQASGHTRFPLCNRELDEVLGVLDIRDVLFAARGAREPDLRTLATAPTYFPELTGAERLLAEFRTRHLLMAIVVDEYGGASGILTATDVIASIVGEMATDEADMVPLPGGAYEVDGVAPIEEIEETLRISLDVADMRTVAGFLMQSLGRMPRPGDRVTRAGYVFTAVEVAGPKVRRVRIHRELASAAAAPPTPVPE